MQLNFSLMNLEDLWGGKVFSFVTDFVFVYNDKCAIILSFNCKQGDFKIVGYILSGGKSRQSTKIAMVTYLKENNNNNNNWI